MCKIAEEDAWTGCDPQATTDEWLLCDWPVADWPPDEIDDELLAIIEGEDNLE
jgi:hypothetical protein